MPTRKATAADPRLDLYALAQVRADELVEKLGPRCKKECEGGCTQTRWAALGRSDWPRCPLTMLRDPLWQGIADLYRGSRVSALSGFPEAFTPVAVDGLAELEHAVQEKMRADIRNQQRGG